MTLPLSSRTPSTAHGDGPRDRISHRDAIATTLPPTGTSPDAAVDDGVALFTSHYDVARGDVLALLPSTPSRDRRSAAAAFATDPQKRSRSPAAAATPTAAPTPSGRPRKKNKGFSAPPSPRRAVRAVFSALASPIDQSIDKSIDQLIDRSIDSSIDISIDQ
jgi:hypothetical protein